MGKPTLDLKPKQIWIEERFEEVCKAIAERYEALQIIPIEWIEEYNDLAAKLSPKA